MLEAFLKGKLFGHPIHAMLIHFPSALYPSSVLFAWLGYFITGHCFGAMAFYLLLLGLITSLLAIVFGAIDLSQLDSAHPAWNKAAWHGLLNCLWLFLFVIIVGLDSKQYPTFEPLNLGELAFESLLIIGLIYSNFLGGDLVFKHSIGVKKNNVKY